MWLMTDQESLTFAAIVALMVAVVLMDREIDCAKGSPYIREARRAAAGEEHQTAASRRVS